MTAPTVVADPAAAAAELVASAAARGEHIALSGGSTPRRAYEQAAGAAADWSSATLWFGDERCVPPDHEHSNYGMAKVALLDRIAGGAPAVRRMKGELGPDAGAEDYEHQLRTAFGDGAPRLDLVLMGLGPDAHTASLFPGKPAVEVRDRPVVGVPEAGLEPFVPRITLTLPAVNAAARVVFLVAGADKAEAATRAFGGSADAAAPASLVAPTSGTLELLLDPAAAVLLR